ncbi:MAG TPA: M23 family metallopeptidase, partial [Longimicrobiaceae bacterium]|nr:M23 family metallopeptidase [Longimicrobiaceae bacterium]
APARGGDAGTGSAFLQRYAALRETETRAADRAEAALASVPVALPVRGRLTSSYTPRRFHPILKRVRPHWGVDIAAPAGSPVVASADGTVVGVAASASYGLVVDVAHRGGEFITRYAHLSAVLVREGQPVRRGEPLGRVGSTGLSTGPHLHYEVFVRGRRRDPALLFDPAVAAGLLP